MSDSGKPRTSGRGAVTNEDSEPAEQVNEAPPIAISPTPETAVLIVDLKSHHCRWPIWDPLEKLSVENRFYCGRDKGTDRTYCAHHRARASTPIVRTPK